MIRRRSMKMWSNTFDIEKEQKKYKDVVNILEKVITYYIQNGKIRYWKF